MNTYPFAGEIKMEKIIKDGKEVIEWEPLPLQSDRFSVDPVTGNVGIGTPSQEPVAWANSFDLQNFDMKVRTGPDLHHTVPLYTAPQPTQPEQDPVAWRWKERINNDFDSWVVTHSEPPPYAVEQQPLYTAPPKREWVGLTDEEINSVCYKRDWTAPWTNTTFARAIEAKLKEKNKW